MNKFRCVGLNPLLVDFEETVGLDAAGSARLLGIGYSTYAAYRNARRELPPYHAKHIAAILAIPQLKRTTYVKENSHG